MLVEQYADSEILRDRIRLHEEHSTSDVDWWDWVFDRVRAAADAAGAPTDATVLEVGCGPGDLWSANADRVPVGWTVVATDFSPGMVAEHRTATAAADLEPGAVAAAAAEAPSLPEGFADVVVANHMLYHVDRERALPELRRVLRPGGRLVATTNGEATMREVRALLAEVSEAWAPVSDAFSLQNGGDQLRAVFDAVERHEVDAGLRVPELEPLVAYAGTLPGMGEAETAAFAERAREALADGPLEVTKEQGAFVAAVER